MEILNYIFTEQDIIGKGGMGSVYKAKHKFIEGEMAAVKVINANMITDFTRQLLQQEAQNLSSLNHPNIVQFKNYHIDGQGNIYLIMEYVDGLSLDQYIRKETGLIVESRICPIFEPILDAVGYAHKRGAHGKGIMHLDIKPANIIIKKEKTSDGEEKIVPKILDFGIAQIIKTEDVVITGGPTKKVIMGTPSYMSPEQTKGESLDSRSDIYSLGVLLHQMLIGRPPYDTTTLSEFDINRKVMEDPLPRIKSYYEQHSTRVQKVIDKATAKDRKDRYQSCEEFKKALHEAVYPPKIPVWVKTSIAAAIALLIGVGGWFWDYNRVKVSYYKDYVEQWGVPIGIGKLSVKEHSHAHRSYKFEERRRKLIRVSHVNSLDNVIDDGESERNERPIDQELYYTAEGKVNRILVKDRSGKVLYVKNYNDNLRVMAFQYNDEHNTERVLSNSTVGYGRLLESNDDERGRISRWWIEYDENGFAKTEMYHGLDNSIVGDKNGIYGRSYVRDEKGRPVEIHYLGIDGQPQSTSWGLGIKKFVYDEKDNWTEAIYQTIDGQIAYDDVDGIAIFKMEYDDYGNVVKFYHLDGEGKPMCPKKNYVSGGCYVYDDKGMTIQDEYWDMDLKPMFVQNLGIAIVKSEYDENGYVSKKTYCDPDGNIVNCKEGNAVVEYVNDAHGNQLEVWCRDANGELCEVEGGYAGVKQEFDSLGNQTKLVFYGKNQEPVTNENGIVGWVTAYNDRDLVVAQTNLGKNMEPCADNDNVMRIGIEYDNRGNRTRFAYYEADGQSLRLNREGIAGWEYFYDERSGNQTERRYFDANGNIIVSPVDGYAVVRYTYDENEHLNSIRYLDAKMNPILVDGKAGYDYVNDKRGNTLESKPIGKDGKRASGWLISKSEYDQYDNCIGWALFDDQGPATNKVGIHRYQYAFNTRNQQIEERHYGKDGKLAIIDDETRCAIQRDEYDDKGNRVKIAFYGTDEMPCLCKEGWSSSTQEYNAFGKVIKQCFYGLDGKPTDPKVMVPVGICEYDKWGNMVYIAAQDGNGNFINKEKEDWSINRMEYDQRNNRISSAYFDVKDMPALVEKSYHKWTALYDGLDNLLERAYYGINGEPVLYDGYHKVVRKYDENNHFCTEEAYFGTKGEAVTCISESYHKIVKKYNDNNQTILYALYNAKGKVINKTEYTYDEQGRKATEKYTDASGGVLKAVYYYKDDEDEPYITKVYDSQGNLVATIDANGNWKIVDSPAKHKGITPELREVVAEIQSQLPLTENGLTIVSCQIVNNHVEMVMKLSKSKYEYSEEELLEYKTDIQELVQDFADEYSALLKVVLFDQKGRELYRK